MSSSQRGVAIPALPPASHAAADSRGAAGWVVLVAGGLLAAALVAGGVAAAAAAIGAGWSARAADAGYVGCIALPLILGALAAGLVSGDPLRLGRAGIAGGAAWSAIGVAGVALAAAAGAWSGGVATRGAMGADLALLPGSLLMLVQASGEEAYLRGWLMPALARRWGAGWGIALSALLFAGLHVLGGARAPLTLVNMALGGLLFGLLAWRSGGLAASIAAHFGWNWGEALLLGLDPNPGVGSFGAVVDLDLTGPRWLGGSDEGLNASLPMTAVLVLLVLLAARWRWPRPAIREGES